MVANPSGVCTKGCWHCANTPDLTYGLFSSGPRPESEDDSE